MSRCFEADREREPIMYTTKWTAVYTHSQRQRTQYTLKYTHTKRVCLWAEGVGEGLGGWYKASLKYKYWATTTEPFQHGWHCCMDMVDPCRSCGYCNNLSFTSLLSEWQYSSQYRRRWKQKACAFWLPSLYIYFHLCDISCFGGHAAILSQMFW